MTPKLDVKITFAQMSKLIPVIVDTLERDPVTAPEEFEGRRGYEANFLEGWSIPFPELTGTARRDMLELQIPSGIILNYTHFSIIMSKSRKMALVAGVNIVGGEERVYRNNDKWYLDGRILADQHFGNELYKNNRLDRGHLVRREDPVWGRDAEQANADTFHYTNSAPQMDIYNQKVWLGLENYILKNARVHKLMVSVFTGPIFSHTDVSYEYEPGNFARIPGAYWKVVAFLKEDGTPSATAYKISQDKELTELEFDYGPYKTYQISVNEVMDSTGLDFSELLQYDGFSNSELESLAPKKNLLTSLEDIVI